MEITLSAYAKINLFLWLLGKRPDGYHEISSVFQSISLADEITLHVEAGEGVSIHVDGGYLPSDDKNLAVKAAKLFWEGMGSSTRDAMTHIVLRKKIQVGRGLGGGSADAAAVLLGLNEVAGRPFSFIRLTEMAAKIGSDVPFCLTGGTALCGGRGERITQLPDFKGAFVLMNPSYGVQTKWAYAAWDEKEGEKISRRHPEGSATWEGQIGENDFETVVMDHHPDLRDWKKRLLEVGATAAGLSGSGSTVFGLFETRPLAEKTARVLQGHGGEIMVVETVPKGVEVWSGSLSGRK